MNEYALRELGTIITGNTPSKKQSEFYDSDDIPFIKPDDFSFRDTINKFYENKNFISVKAKSNARIVEKNSVLVTCIGIIGKVLLTDKEVAFNQQINAIIPNEKVLSKYLAYNLLYNQYRLQFIANAPVVPIINKTQFSDFKIKIHSNILEQKQIVNKLEKIEVLIRNRNKQLSELDNLVKSRFNEMFGDVLSNDKNFPVSKLGDSLFLKAGKTTKASEIKKEQSNKYSIPCFGGNGIRGFVTDFSYEGDYPIIGRQGALCGNVKLASGKFHATEHAILVISLAEDNSTWLYYYLKYLKLERYQTGAAQPGLSVATLNQIDIFLPPLSLQNQFADFVEEIDKSKLAVKQSLKELEILKKKLMQDYFG